MNITNQETKQHQAKNPNSNPLIEIPTAEDSCTKPDGAKAVSGPTGSSMSGFGLREEGIVGMDDPSGEADARPGDGSRGVMSGDSSVSGSGRTAGAAEMVGICEPFWCVGIMESERKRMRVRRGAIGSNDYSERDGRIRVRERERVLMEMRIIMIEKGSIWGEVPKRFDGVIIG